jgi:phosphoesterase RecJ-like protein
MQDIHNDNIQALQAMIADARKISIVTHQKPDGDAMGSSIALYHYLRMCGKDSVRIILNDRFPGYLDFLTSDIPQGGILFFQEMQDTAEILLRDSDLIFCLDFNAFHRTDKMENALTDSKARKILIDHHLNPDRNVFDLTFSETEISSASELLYQILIHTSHIRMDATLLPPQSAIALMTGMTTDTNNFANSTYPSTFLMASDLLAAGVDRDAILSQLYNQYGENRLRVMGYMMKDLLTITQDGVAYIVLNKADQERYNVAEGDTEGFVNMPLSIGKVRMSILAKEDEGKIRISIRSRKGTSANGCAKTYFNGGGHENAAGGRLMIPEDVPGVEAVAEYIEKHTHNYLDQRNEKN